MEIREGFTEKQLGYNFNRNEVDPFFNINTPDDLEEAKYRLKEGLLWNIKTFLVLLVGRTQEKLP